MRSTITRWTLYCLGLFILGPAAGYLVSMVRAVDGGPASPLNSASPVLGLIVAIAAIAIALALGILTGRLLGPAPALTAAGIVAAWAAWKSADTQQLIRTAQSSAPFIKLSIEGAILGVVGLAGAIACLIAASRPETPWRPATSPRVISKNALATIIVGVLAGGVAAWLIAATPLKGQAVFAAIAGGTMAAAAARLVDIESPLYLMFVPVTLLAILSPLTGFISGDAVAAAYKGSLFPLANISPLDWIAGGLLGIPLGVSWAGSMIEKRTHDAPAPAPAR